MADAWSDVLVAVGLLALLLLALECGFRVGRRHAAEHDSRASNQVGAILGAILGLLGLLLAFSFGAAGTRFLERQDLIVQEANAIGTATLRADLLDEPHRTNLRSALRQYTEHRVNVSTRLRGGLNPTDAAEFDRLQAVIWNAAIAGVNAKPTTIIGVLPPVNDIIDIHSVRVAAAHKHIPALVLGLLIANCVLAMAVIGFSCGPGGSRRAPLTDSLALLIGAALWVTIDLDHPRMGLMQLNDAPLKALKFDTPAAPAPTPSPAPSGKGPG